VLGRTKNDLILFVEQAD